MFLLLVTLSALLAPALLKPQDPASIASQAVKAEPIPIVDQSAETNPDGSFQYRYETGNGIKVEEKGYLKDGKNASEKIQVIEGTLTYTDNNGEVINLKYIADENGFQPTGDHIPQAPAAQSVPQPSV
ncbi:hypothetical protein JTB14_028402 [Gonioctena quinquepunctata]|nr:hypothetical protein JTB14_028402 [Gonioctena quinquepunctata]